MYLKHFQETFQHSQLHLGLRRELDKAARPMIRRENAHFQLKVKITRRRMDFELQNRSGR